MTLLNAPAYNEHREKLKKTILLGSTITFAVLVVLTLAGFLSGHGWLFTDLPAEHKVSNFFYALEAKDYNKAFAIYNNDSDWQQHPAKYKDYPIERFTEDWTTASPADAPIQSHHVDISRTDGSGTFGTGIIVAVTVKAVGKPREKRLFMYYLKHDGTMTYPAPHILEY